MNKILILIQKMFLYKFSPPKKFVKINFEWDKAKDNFDAFMIMNFPLQKTMVARSGDDLIGLNSAGHLKFGAPSFIHTGQSSEVYTQMATTNAKV